MVPDTLRFPDTVAQHPIFMPFVVFLSRCVESQSIVGVNFVVEKVIEVYVTPEEKTSVLSEDL